MALTKIKGIFSGMAMACIALMPSSH
ncbi:uncharacterized protein G2W53_006172 [Senna tora]|uniref:Uncharacterized protein n=1 Tax=Senna tora TaxID=362788 RepID=A0A835CEJ5_9FABA|nr:uncharacterized protein G2W53_006172 [Senna tora]